VVGGTLDTAPPEQVGYRLQTAAFGSLERLMLVAEIRLFSNNGTPTYHVLVGDVLGIANVTAVLQKIGYFANIEEVGSASGVAGADHWIPRAWPLPFWSTDSRGK